MPLLLWLAVGSASAGPFIEAWMVKLAVLWASFAIVPAPMGPT